MIAMTPRKPTGPGSWSHSLGVQLLLLLDIWTRCMIWALAMSATIFVMLRTQFLRSLTWESMASFAGAWRLCTTVTNFILLFNVFYVVVLILVRLPFPAPASGVYKLRGRPRAALVLGAVLAVLTKARYHAPFPGIFVSQISNFGPFRWLMSLQFGPRTKTSFFLDPILTDPWGVTIGRNVTFGFGATVAAHLQERDYIVIDRVVIEDDVIIGAYAGIGCGVHIKRGAFIEPFAAVRPGTLVGEGELWGGVPARKKRMYRPGTGMKPTVEESSLAAAAL